MDGSSWQLEIGRPWCLLGLVVLPAMVYYAVRTLVGFARWQRIASLAIRVLLVVLLVIALSGVRLITRSSRHMVVFAVDRSLSAEGARGAAAAFLEEARKHVGENRMAVLPFAAEPGAVADRLPGRVPENRAATDLEAAIIAACAAAPSTHVASVVLLGDGNQTRGNALAAARASVVPISTVPLAGRPQREVLVRTLESPGRARPGDPLLLQVVVESTHEDEGTVQLFFGPDLLEQRRVRIGKGKHRLRFTQRAPGRAAATFTAKIAGFDDTIQANNRASAVVLAAPRAKVLIVDGHPDRAGHLGRALKDQAVDAEILGPQDMPRQQEALQAYDLLIVSNVPAASLPREQMELIRRYVSDFGGGLIVVGGDRAFTPGGYQDTVLEDVLPLRSCVREDRPRTNLAMVLVIDQSLSMRGKAMELAKQATRRAIERLGPRDQVGVIAFEDQSRWISEIRPCSDKQAVLRRVDSITAGARGGTNIYPAMEKAYLALDEAFAELKHMIVLSDGLSHPGDFHALAADIAASGITVSTVAVGEDAARQLLKDIAQVGQGHYYYCGDPADVPAIFELETITAGKLGIAEGSFSPRADGSAWQAAGLELAGAPVLLGYAQTRPKPACQVVMVIGQGDPLLAWWRYGRGLCAAFTSDVHTRWAAAWLRWPGFGRFWARLVRHAARRGSPDACQLRLHRQGERATVTLDAADRHGTFLNGARATLRIIDPRRDGRKQAFRQIAPGRYAAEFGTAMPGTYFLETRLVHRGQLVDLQHRALVIAYPEELRVRPTNDALLRSIAEASGGRYAPKPADLFGPLPRKVRQSRPLWPYLLAATMLAFLLDLALRRIDLSRSADR